MHFRIRRVAIAVAALLAARTATAEPLGSYFTLTPFAGYTTFDANLNFPDGTALTNDLYAGGRFGWRRSWYGIEAAGGFTPTREDNPYGQDVNFWHASGNLMASPYRSRNGDVFLLAGYGYGSLTASGGCASCNIAAGTKSDAHYGTVELGGGVRFWMTDVVGVRLEARNISLMQKTPVKFLNNNLVFGAGIELAIGGTPRDTDHDGVPDKKDKCPNTPAGAKVDVNGCPLDTDGDGVFDGLDHCPGTPKGCRVDAQGCPIDADGDGVCDGLDKCPDTPRGAKVDKDGCPIDSDGDGVYDGLDKCEGTPKGCTVDSVGCPRDADGDGVCDGVDLCPDTPAGARVDATGCPIEVIERETEMLDTGMIRLNNINFATGKSDLLPEDLPTLDVVGQVMTKWPELKIEVGGHTDDRGSAAMNQKLSEARAQSVMKYIVQKFPNLKPDQYTAKGYGKTRPIVPNSTDLNRAKNRRVEFVVQNKDVLKREIERRRLLQKGETAPVAPAKPDTTKIELPVTPAPPDTTKKP
jgi:outer membrane protein OmpA-like peptidoglycan-associated protein